jgi:L-glyceraldehyde 3-phosphate reductase
MPRLGRHLALESALVDEVLETTDIKGATEVQRATARPTFDKSVLTEKTLSRVRGLDAIARRRGQTLAQMALVWVLRDRRVTSALVGASSVEQLAENLAALEQPRFTPEELAEIDRHAVDSGIDLWRASSEL